MQKIINWQVNEDIKDSHVDFLNVTLLGSYRLSHDVISRKRECDSNLIYLTHNEINAFRSVLRVTSRSICTYDLRELYDHTRDTKVILLCSCSSH